MLNRTNLLIVLVALVGAALGLLAGNDLKPGPTLSVPPGMKVLEPGDQRADLELADVDGKPRRLSEWDGKPVLINFWATWCGPCREEMPLLDQTRARMTGKNLEVLGVAVDKPDAVRDFLERSPVHYPILVSDEFDDASLQFGDRRGVLPFSVLIGSDGKVLAQRSGGFSEDSLAVWLKRYLPD